MTVYSDHKPLECIVKKPLDTAPESPQGMLLRAMAYDADVEYIQGKLNLIADPLSRSFLPFELSQYEFEKVNALQYLTIPAEEIHGIRKITNEDEILQLLKRSIQEGWPEKVYFLLKSRHTTMFGINVTVLPKMASCSEVSDSLSRRQ